MKFLFKPVSGKECKCEGRDRHKNWMLTSYETQVHHRVNDKIRIFKKPKTYKKKAEFYCSRCKNKWKISKNKYSMPLIEAKKLHDKPYFYDEKQGITYFPERIGYEM